MKFKLKNKEKKSLAGCSSKISHEIYSSLLALKMKIVPEIYIYIIMENVIFMATIPEFQ